MIHILRLFFFNPREKVGRKTPACPCPCPDIFCYYYHSRYGPILALPPGPGPPVTIPSLLQ